MAHREARSASVSTSCLGMVDSGEVTIRGLAPRVLVLQAALVTPFEGFGDNAAISGNQWGTDKELNKELWRYLQFLNLSGTRFLPPLLESPVGT